MCLFYKIKLCFYHQVCLISGTLKIPGHFLMIHYQKNVINLKWVKICRAVHITKSGFPTSKIAIVRCACVVACVLAPTYTFHQLWHHQGLGNTPITKPIYRTGTKEGLKRIGRKITFTFSNEGRRLLGFSYWWDNIRHPWLIR